MLIDLFQTFLMPLCRQQDWEPPYTEHDKNSSNIFSFFKTWQCRVAAPYTTQSAVSFRRNYFWRMSHFHLIQSKRHGKKKRKRGIYRPAPRQYVNDDWLIYKRIHIIWFINEYIWLINDYIIISYIILL